MNRIDRSGRLDALLFALALFVLPASAGQQAYAQSPPARDVSGTTWDCRIQWTKAAADGRADKSGFEDDALITFNPGGSSVSVKLLDDRPPASGGKGQEGRSFGKWEQGRATVRAVSNGTVESFRSQPWKEGDAERQVELKLSGDQMQGEMLSRSTTDRAVFKCQLQFPPPGENISAISSSSQFTPESVDIDVRISPADSRLLTSAEMAALRDTLHWDPELVRLRSGGTAISYLLDKQGRRLGWIRVQWTKTTVHKGSPSEPAGPPVGSFTVEMQNGTSCGFLGQAELDDAKGGVILSSIDLDSWVGLNQPEPGQTVRVEGDANLPSPNTTIDLKPLSVSSTLSACATPKNPQHPAN